MRLTYSNQSSAPSQLSLLSVSFPVIGLTSFSSHRDIPNKSKQHLPFQPSFFSVPGTVLQTSQDLQSPRADLKSTSFIVELS